MRAVIEFDLPEEQEEYDSFTNARKYQHILWEIKQEVRKIWKYEELDGVSAEDMVDRIYTIICDAIADEGVGHEF